MQQLQSDTSALPVNDLVTSLAFSPLSTHLALASLDHHLRILHPTHPTLPDYHPHRSDSHNRTAPSHQPAWTRSPREWKAHDGPVLALAWAPPEFGTVVASGGVDGAVKIWREDEPPSSSSSSCSGPTSSSTPSAFSSAALASRRSAGGTTGQGWSLCATLTDSLGTVRSLSFLPASSSSAADSGRLKLAAVASDSHLRVWECLDPAAGLAEWTLLHDIEVASLPLAPCSAASLAGGSGFGGAGSSGVPGVDGGDGKASNTSATGSTASVDGRSAGPGGRGGTVESDGGWAVSWCREGWWGERLAVTAGTNGVVRLFHFPTPSSTLSSTLGPWSQFLVLLPPPSSSSAYSSRPFSSSSSAISEDTPTTSSALHTPPTSSLSFAPPSGRSFQLLATGARDGKARVWKLFPPSLGAPPAPPGPGDHPSVAAAAGGVVAPRTNDPEEGDWTAKLDVELDTSLLSSSSSSAVADPADRLAASRGQAPQRAEGAGTALGAVRVEWNVTGTVLSTSGGVGEDGRVRLWKPTYTGQWRLLATLSTQDAPACPAVDGGGGGADGAGAGGIGPTEGAGGYYVPEGEER